MRRRQTIRTKPIPINLSILIFNFYFHFLCTTIDSSFFATLRRQGVGCAQSGSRFNSHYCIAVFASISTGQIVSSLLQINERFMQMGLSGSIRKFGIVYLFICEKVYFRRCISPEWRSLYTKSCRCRL